LILQRKNKASLKESAIDLTGVVAKENGNESKRKAPHIFNHGKRERRRTAKTVNNNNNNNKAAVAAAVDCSICLETVVDMHFVAPVCMAICNPKFPANKFSHIN
jgi:hypothetical protein